MNKGESRRAALKASLGRFWNRLAGRTGGAAATDIEREIDEELAFHLEMRTRENIAAGMSPDEARRRARERFGEIDAVRRQGHRIRGRGAPLGALPRMLGDLTQDVRFALRGMARAPGHTAVAIIALTLGIGVTTAVFSVIDGVLLQPFPYDQPDRLVTIVGAGVRPETSAALTGLDTLADATLFTIGSPEMVGPEGAVRADALEVGPRFFEVLGVRPARGRALTDDDYRADAQPVAVITDRLWRGFLRGRDNVVGSTLALDGVPHEIVGVLPTGVTMLVYERYDVFVPLEEGDDGRMILGRLRDGVSFEQARDQALALAATFGDDDVNAELGRLAGNTRRPPSIYYRSLYEQVVGGERDGLLLLAGAAALVLLIAAANVANLSLARALARRGEISVRAALGAGSGRLLRQLLTESGVLALIGGSFGALLAVWGVPTLMAISPDYMARADNVAVDTRVLVFTLGVSLLVGVLSGLVPLSSAGRADVGRAMTGERAGSGPPRAGRRLLTALVIGEVAFSLVVLVTTGLLVRAFLEIRPSQPGFDPAGKLVFEVRPSARRYPDAAARGDVYGHILDRLRALPGATDAAAISSPPLLGVVWPITAVPEGMDPAEDDLPVVWLEHASANYHALMDIPVVRGRALQSPAAGPAEIVLSETAARTLFGDADALGKRVRLDLPDGLLAQYVADHRLADGYVVVGIAADTLRLGNSKRPRPTVWVDFLSGGDTHMSFLVAARGEPGEITPEVRELIGEIDPLMPIEYVDTMDNVVHASVSLPRFYMVLMAVFGTVAGLLAVIGFYGVMAFSIGQRTRELGVRVAMGASPAAIRGMVLGQGARIIAAGIALGLMGCFAVTRLMESLLYGLSPTDPLTYAALTALLALIGLIACWIPALRATHADPLIALRQE
ncbi:MAG: ABC transporter permease [Acidobacteriota bacterium]|jgi:predicted permease